MKRLRQSIAPTLLFILLIHQIKFNIEKEIELISLKFPIKKTVPYISYKNNIIRDLDYDTYSLLKDKTKTDNKFLKGKDLLSLFYKIIELKLEYSLYFTNWKNNTIEKQINAIKKQIKIKNEINKYIEETFKN